jgi:hypothetical protein
MLNPSNSSVWSSHPWLKVLQALILGFVLGLAVHTGLSLMLVNLGADAPRPAGRSRSGVECRKQQQPARQTTQPPVAPRPLT